MRYLKITFIIAAFLAIFLPSCKQKDPLSIPTLEAHFHFNSTGNFRVLNAGDTYKLPVGITTASKNDITIDLDIKSTSGAEEGVQYNISKKKAFIPSGGATDTLLIQGILGAYLDGRRDTLVISIIEKNGLKAVQTNKTFTLYIAGPCAESKIILSEMIGTYSKTTELFGTSPFGPYTTRITSVKQWSSTTGEISVQNIYGIDDPETEVYEGWNNVKFILDWTDPGNRLVYIAPQSGIGDAGTLNSAYSGNDISVRPFVDEIGTFSYCDKTLTLKLQVGITELNGWFPQLYQVFMKQ